MSTTAVTRQADPRGVAVIEAPAVSVVRPAIQPAALVQVHREITALITECLEQGRDYGAIPGTGNKPTLLKPGAERLAIAFGTYPRYEIIEREIDHEHLVEWTKRKKNRYGPGVTQETGTSVGLYRYVVRCTLVRREDGAVVAEGLGACSTMESKYVDRPRDMENTVLKMAEKRALVAAALNGFGLSDRFTQDLEDGAEVDAPSKEARAKAASGASEPETATEPAPEPSALAAGTFPFPGPHRGKPLDARREDGSYLFSDGTIRETIAWCSRKQMEERPTEARQHYIAAASAELLRRDRADGLTDPLAEDAEPATPVARAERDGLGLDDQRPVRHAAMDAYQER
jgi:hypothetical protein